MASGFQSLTDLPVLDSADIEPFSWADFTDRSSLSKLAFLPFHSTVNPVEPTLQSSIRLPIASSDPSARQAGDVVRHSVSQRSRALCESAQRCLKRANTSRYQHILAILTKKL